MRHVGVIAAMATGAVMAGGLLPGAVTSASSSGPADAVVGRFLQAGPPTVYGYEARRTLEASAQGGRLRASMEAMVTLEDGTFEYRIVEERGSAVLRRYVLERALEEERRTINEGRAGEAALTAANYRFVAASTEASGTVSVGLIPHQPAALLLEGRLRLDPAGGLIAVTGQPSTLPSFWTLRVDIERHYADITGHRVPTLMRSRAIVRLAGTGTFEMRYAYQQINGRRVGGGSGQQPIAPSRRRPHIIPAHGVGESPSMRKLS